METQHTTYTGVITEDLFPPAPADSARRGTCPSRSQHTPQTNTISPESPWRGAPSRPRGHPGASASTSRARPHPGHVHVPGTSTSQARPRPGPGLRSRATHPQHRHDRSFTEMLADCALQTRTRSPPSTPTLNARYGAGICHTHIAIRRPIHGESDYMDQF